MILYDKSGMGPFPVNPPLRGFASGQFRSVPPARFANPIQSGIHRSIHENDRIALPVQARFKEERRIDDDRRRRRIMAEGFGHQFQAGSLDKRMDEALEPPAIRVALEDDPRHRLPVDLPVRAENPIPPPLLERLSHIRPPQRFGGERVVVHNDTAHFGEGASDGALARADAAGQADHERVASGARTARDSGAGRGFLWTLAALAGHDLMVRCSEFRVPNWQFPAPRSL